MKIGKVYFDGVPCGILKHSDEYYFSYLSSWLKKEGAEPISLTMPLTDKVYKSKRLFPFFDNLIPEGWILDVVIKNSNIDPVDRMELLLKTCKDPIGAVSVEEIDEEEKDEK